MAAASPHATFSNSRLVRQLAALAGGAVAAAGAAEGVDAKQTFAARLGLWLDWTDAIALSAVLNHGAALTSADANADAQADAQHLQGAAVEACSRVRKDLVKLATADVAFAADPAGNRGWHALPASKTAAVPEGAVDFSPYRRDYLAHQRAMESSIGPLRLNVRAALSSQSADLARLAALDAVLDEALRPRERQVLASVPARLEWHFEHLQQTQAAETAATVAADGQEPPIRSATWLARYHHDMQGVLLAELDLRLQPIEGMMEALRHETTP